MLTARSRRAAYAAACTLALAPMAAAQESCPLTYDLFEVSVPHTDLDACPEASDAAEGTYCRVAVAAETATIFVFSEAEDCLVSTVALYDEAFSLSFE